MNKAILCALGLALSQVATANSDIDAMQQLFDSGRTVQAYELGLDLQGQYEGDPRFDYYFGASAIDAGDASNGVFALERVLLLQPNNQAARLELARGYFILEEYERSKREFETALKANPPQDARIKIEQYLDAIRLKEGRYRSTTLAYVSLGLGHDSNINSAPVDPTFNLGDVEITLSDDDSLVSEMDSIFEQVGAGVSVNTPLTPNWSFVYGGDLLAEAYDEDSFFNNNTLTGNIGFDQRFKSTQLSYRFNAQTYTLDGDQYRNLYALNTTLKQRFTDQDQMQLFLQLGLSKYPGQRERDGNQYILGGSYLHIFGGAFAPTLSAGAYIGQDTIDDNQNVSESLYARDFYGLNLGSQILLGQRNSLSLNLGYQMSEYAENYLDGLFVDEVKEDDTLTATLKHTLLLGKAWQLDSSVAHTTNDSNIALGEYDRTRVLINARYTFR